YQVFAVDLDEDSFFFGTVYYYPDINLYRGFIDQAGGQRVYHYWQQITDSLSADDIAATASDWNIALEKAGNPIRIGDKVGIHDLHQGVFYTARVDSVKLEYFRENESFQFAFTFLRAQNDSVAQYSSPSKSYSGRIVVWKPNEANGITTEFNPNVFKGIRRLNIENVRNTGFWRIKETLNDSLRVKDISQVCNAIFMINIESKFNANDKGNLQFWHLTYPYLASDEYGTSNVIIKFEERGHRSRMLILDVETSSLAVPQIENNPPLRSFIVDPYEEPKYYYTNELIGVIDADFDGTYELVHSKKQIERGSGRIAETVKVSKVLTNGTLKTICTSFTDMGC
ncbi:hypothetical protein ACFLQV_03885, partial [Calditrichota bacterium]